MPADVLTAALFARFRSRQEHTFGEKMLSAMRFGFGGHIEGQEPIDPEPSQIAAHAAARNAAGSAMLDKPIQRPPTAQIIACPPRRRPSRPIPARW